MIPLSICKTKWFPWLQGSPEANEETTSWGQVGEQQGAQGPDPALKIGFDFIAQSLTFAAPRTKEAVVLLKVVSNNISWAYKRFCFFL